jgi:hypothetical protein
MRAFFKLHSTNPSVLSLLFLFPWSKFLVRQRIFVFVFNKNFQFYEHKLDEKEKEKALIFLLRLWWLNLEWVERLRQRMNNGHTNGKTRSYFEFVVYVVVVRRLKKTPSLRDSREAKSTERQSKGISILWSLITGHTRGKELLCVLPLTSSVSLSLSPFLKEIPKTMIIRVGNHSLCVWQSEWR